VGLPRPGVAELRDSFATFAGALAAYEDTLEVSPARLTPEDSRTLPEAVRAWVEVRTNDDVLAEEMASAVVRARGTEDWSAFEDVEKQLRQIGTASVSGRLSANPLSGLVASRQWQTLGEHLAQLSYLEEAVRQVGIDLGWTLASEGRANQAGEVQQVFEAAARRAEADEARTRFWREAEMELQKWIKNGSSNGAKSLSRILKRRLGAS
jgi:hypothetical protein